jgi:hypothetical protein
MLRLNPCWWIACSAVAVACGGDLTLPRTGEGDGPPAGPESPGGHVLAALDDRYSTFEGDGHTLSIAAPGVLANDRLDGVESLALGAALAESPAHGVLDLRADGSLAYTPDADWFGLDRFTYRATLDGAVSAPAEVVVEVQPVNDAPTFVAGPDLFANENEGERTVSGWARDILAGPPNESDQQVSFLVEIVSGERLLRGAPDIDATGTLRFRLSGHHGIALLSVRPHDDGGTANGGEDTGPAHLLVITISH